MTLALSSCVGGRETGGGEAQEPATCGTEPPSRDSYLHHSSVCFSLFIFHVLSWHERDLFPSRRRGRLRSALGSRRRTTRRGGCGRAGVWGCGQQLFWIQSIKTGRAGREVFPRRTCRELSPVQLSRTCSFRRKADRRMPTPESSLLNDDIKPVLGFL